MRREEKILAAENERLVFIVSRDSGRGFTHASSPNPIFCAFSEAPLFPVFNRFYRVPLGELECGTYSEI